jgi:hypothetical protein
MSSRSPGEKRLNLTTWGSSSFEERWAGKQAVVAVGAEKKGANCRQNSCCGVLLLPKKKKKKKTKIRWERMSCLSLRFVLRGAAVVAAALRV